MYTKTIIPIYRAEKYYESDKFVVGTHDFNGDMHFIINIPTRHSSRIKQETLQISFDNGKKWWSLSNVNWIFKKIEEEYIRVKDELNDRESNA